jgi:hypothetical protein
MDKSGGRMQLTLFNSAVDKFDFLETNIEYLISEGTIKPAKFVNELAKHPF